MQSVDRQVKAYVVPNTASLPSLPPDLVRDGWRPAADAIDDNLPDEDTPNGHGTLVACVAGANSAKYGVAWNANLMVIKAAGHFTRQYNGRTELAEGPSPTFRAAAVLDAFEEIYDAFQDGVDPTRTVILLSIGRCSLEGIRVDSG